MPPTPASAGHQDAPPASFASGGTAETMRRTGLAALGSRRIGAAAWGRRVLGPLARPIPRLEPAPLRAAPGLRPAPSGGVRFGRRPVRRLKERPGCRTGRRTPPSKS
jgi:hypothetical protein